MSEYADDAASYGLDEWRGAGTSRGMNFWPSEQGQPRMPPYMEGKRTKVCSRCGATPLYWEQIEGKWKLHAYKDGQYVLHSC